MVVGVVLKWSCVLLAHKLASYFEDRNGSVYGPAAAVECNFSIDKRTDLKSGVEVECPPWRRQIKIQLGLCMNDSNIQIELGTWDQEGVRSPWPLLCR